MQFTFRYGSEGELPDYSTLNINIDGELKVD